MAVSADPEILKDEKIVFVQDQCVAIEALFVLGPDQQMMPGGIVDSASCARYRCSFGKTAMTAETVVVGADVAEIRSFTAGGDDPVAIGVDLDVVNGQRGMALFAGTNGQSCCGLRIVTPGALVKAGFMVGLHVGEDKLSRGFVGPPVMAELA